MSDEAWIIEHDASRTGTLFNFVISEQDVRDLASGYVNATVLSMAGLALSEQSGIRDEQRAKRPVRRKKNG